MIAISRTSSSPNPSGAMSCVRNKHLLLSILLLDFTFTNQFLQAQTLIGPNFDEALLPFGSHAITGTLSTRCNRHEFDVILPRAVSPQIIRSFSRVSVRMLTATPWMMQPAHLLVLVLARLTTPSCSAPPRAGSG
ncbi:hypothetical protein SDJN03_09992, partial [Cucurbita argyrosperma subsp. sororia]